MAIDAQEIELLYDLPGSLPPLTSDRTMVGYLLANLIGNAVKYSPSGTTCTVGAYTSGRAFRFWVEDQGIGISPEQLKHVFEPFWQADGSATRKVGGVGLGLYLVKQLTMALKGDVGIESKVGSGTRVTVTLPNVPASTGSPLRAGNGHAAGSHRVATIAP